MVQNSGCMIVKFKGCHSPGWLDQQGLGFEVLGNQAELSNCKLMLQDHFVVNGAQIFLSVL